MKTACALAIVGLLGIGGLVSTVASQDRCCGEGGASHSSSGVSSWSSDQDWESNSDSGARSYTYSGGGRYTRWSAPSSYTWSDTDADGGYSYVSYGDVGAADCDYDDDDGDCDCDDDD